jgi:hypothetical protein
MVSENGSASTGDQKFNGGLKFGSVAGDVSRAKDGIDTFLLQNRQRLPHGAGGCMDITDKADFHVHSGPQREANRSALCFR